MSDRSDVGYLPENIHILGNASLQPTQDYVICREVPEDDRFITRTGIEVVKFSDRGEGRTKECREAEVLAVGPGVHVNTGSPDKPGTTLLNKPQCKVGDRIVIWWHDMFIFEMNHEDKFWIVPAQSVLAVIQHGEVLEGQHAS